MNKLRKCGIILTTIMTIFSTTLIVAKADTTPVINAIHELYQPYPNNNSNLWSVRGVIAINFDSYVTGTLTTTISALDEVILDFNTYVDFYCIGAEATVTANETRITFHIEDEKTILLYYANKYVMNYSSATLSALSVDLTYKSKTLDVISHVDATDVNQISGQMATLLSTMNNIYDQDATMLTKLTTLNTKTDTIISQLTTLTTAVNNIDEQIDTITWNSFASGLLGFTDDLTTYDTATGTQTEQYMIYNAPSPDSWTKNAPCIYKITAPIGNRVITGINFYALYNGALRSFNPEYYYFNMRNSIEIYIIYDAYLENPTQKMNLVLEFVTTQGNIYNYGTSVSPFEITYIPSTDIEYWTLLQYFHTYSYEVEQLNATQELIDIVSQLTSSNSTETTENITNFNTNMEIVNNIENNISTDFGNSKTIFDFNESNKWTFNEDLRTPTNSLNSVFTATINAVTPANTWLSLILLCAVLLAILG